MALRLVAGAASVPAQGNSRAPAGVLRCGIRSCAVVAIACLTAVLLLSGSPALAFPFGATPNAALALDSYDAGASPAHRLSFEVRAGELEVYRATVVYPDQFRFNGFDALGPVNTQVGALTVDFNFDGVPDTTIPLRSLGPSSAYADVIPDGRFTQGVEPMLGRSGGNALTLVLPFGGDARRDTVVVPRAARISVVLFEGLLTNPRAGGSYTISAELTSVDPDTDGPDDGRDPAPSTVAFAVEVTVAPADGLRPLFLHAGP